MGGLDISNEFISSHFHVMMTFASPCNLSAGMQIWRTLHLRVAGAATARNRGTRVESGFSIKGRCVRPKGLFGFNLPRAASSRPATGQKKLWALVPSRV